MVKLEEVLDDSFKESQPSHAEVEEDWDTDGIFPFLSLFSTSSRGSLLTPHEVNQIPPLTNPHLFLLPTSVQPETTSTTTTTTSRTNPSAKESTLYATWSPRSRAGNSPTRSRSRRAMSPRRSRGRAPRCGCSVRASSSSACRLRWPTWKTQSWKGR